MNTYKIKLVSQTNAMLLIMILLATLFGGIFLFVPQGLPKPLSITITFTGFIIAYVLWQKFVTGRTEWTINKDGINMIWVKHFAFTNNKDIFIGWNEIKSISRGFEPQYYNLKIELISGEIIRFYHDTLTTKDDFQEFLTALNAKHSEKISN